MVGMTYYDPWLSYYLQGMGGQQTATSSLGALQQLNSELRSDYKQYGARIAAVRKASNPGTWR
jgi:hypothetical protein